MYTLQLNNDEKLILFELLASIDEEERGLKLDEAEAKLISNLVVQMEPTIEETFLPNYSEILEKSKRNILMF